MQIARALSSLVAAGLVLVPPALAQKEALVSKPPNVGEIAPDFELESCDGRQYKLSDAKDKIVVLEWINQDCPVSRSARPKLKETAEAYAKLGVVWLAIDSTNYQTPEQNDKYRKTHDLPYPILMDNDGKVGRAYGAKVTPHIFVIAKGKLVYAGAHDNQQQRRGREQPEYRNYVAEALDAILAGKDVPSPTTTPYGCPVKYKKEK